MLLNKSDSQPGQENNFTRFDEMSPQSRSFYQRTLGKIEAGAMRGAIFTLISTAIGAGCLTLPLVLYRQGIILGLFLLVFACYCSYLGIMNITHAAENFKVYEYSELVNKVLGSKWKILFDNVIVIYVFGTIIGYQVMIGFFVPSIFHSLNINFDPSIERIIIMIAANLCIMTPLGLLRKLTSLRFMSILSGFTLVYIAFLIICEFPFFEEHNNYDDVSIFRFNLSILASFNICLYSVTCHTNVAQVYDELQRRNLRRMNKVATRSLVGVLVPYIILSIFGYLSTLDDTPNMIIMRSAPRHISNDWLMVLARILMSITLVIAVPINIPPCRNIIIKSWFRVKDERPSNKIHILVTMTLLILTLIIAIVYPNILVLFSILGGFCCGLIVLVIPSKAYLGFLKVKTEGWANNHWKALVYRIGSMTLFLLGTTGAILSVAGIA